MRSALLKFVFAIDARVAAAVTLAMLGSALAPGAAAGQTSSPFQGIVTSGQQPVKGSTIQLYAAGTAGYGSGAQALLSPAVTTDQNGRFSILAGAYSCPSPAAQVYMVSAGGDPGNGQANPQSVMMDALGACGSISSSTFLHVDEVTTVGSVWALAQFMGAGGEVGTSSANLRGMTNAFDNVHNVVNPGTGKSPGSYALAGTTVPVGEIDTLANILAACVNSTDGAACQSLFAAATPSGGTAPANTLSAALDIARNPGNNVAALFALQPASAPFQPSLSAAPTDWTIGVTYANVGLVNPTALAVDAAGNVWVANQCNTLPCASVVKISTTGRVQFASGFTGGVAGHGSFGIAIDAIGNVWYTNETTPWAINYTWGNVVKLNSAGAVGSGPDGYFGGDLYGPWGVATDGSNGWVANPTFLSASSPPGGNGSEFAPGGTPLSSVAGFGDFVLYRPLAVAIDSNGNAWYSNYNSGELGYTPYKGFISRVDANRITVSGLQTPGYGTVGIATDAITSETLIGHVWAVDNLSNDLTKLDVTRDGTSTFSAPSFTGGGLNLPWGVAIDGGGTLWIANQGGGLSVFQGSAGASPGTPICGTAGFGGAALPNGATSLAIDASGAVWVVTNPTSTLTQFLGVAAPVQTPLVGPAKPI